MLLEGRVRVERGVADHGSETAWLVGAVEIRVPLPAGFLALLSAQQREADRDALAITRATLTARFASAD